jgi:hypothetical protein
MNFFFRAINVRRKLIVLKTTILTYTYVRDASAIFLLFWQNVCTSPYSVLTSGHMTGRLHSKNRNYYALHFTKLLMKLTWLYEEFYTPLYLWIFMFLVLPKIQMRLWMSFRKTKVKKLCLLLSDNVSLYNDVWFIFLLYH